LSIDLLQRILPRPVSPSPAASRPDWQAIEKQLCPLPESYKEFIDHYGLGRIDRFLIVYSPTATDKYLNLSARGQIDLDALRELRSKHGAREVPYALYPEPNGLLPFGIDENGDGLYWLTEGPPDQWPIVVNEGRAPEYVRFDATLTEFLAGILSRTLHCEIFPDDFPSDAPTFTPLP
jgi:hypothetical protein